MLPLSPTSGAGPTRCKVLTLKHNSTTCDATFGCSKQEELYSKASPSQGNRAMPATHRLSCFIVALAIALIAGCSSNRVPVSQVKPKIPEPLWQDSAFVNRPKIPSKNEIFALSDEFRGYLTQQLSGHSKGSHARLKRLVELLQDPNALQLTYDNRATHTASQAFASHRGNCLSLAIMTVAIAREWQLKGAFQQPELPQQWEQQGDLYLLSKHVNVVVDIPHAYGIGEDTADSLYIIDFSGNPGLKYLPQQQLSEQRIIAMFYNNLAAEAITEDKLDQAYWLSKAALQVDPQFTPGYATLGVLYARKELLGAAEDIYLQGLRISPEDHTLLSNLAVLLQKQPERSADLLALKPKLDALSLSNPFYYAELAEQAFQQGNYRKSIRLYQRSLELSPYIHTSYFGLAKNHYALGHLKQAEKYLKVASEVSDSLSTQKRYQAKLRYLNEIPITSARLNH